MSRVCATGLKTLNHLSSRGEARAFVALAAALALLGSYGCRHSASEVPGKPARAAAAGTAGEEDEAWFVVHLSGARVGYQQVKRTEVTREGRKLHRVEIATRMDVPREGKPTRLEEHLTSLEAPGGPLIEFEVQSSRGPEPASAAGSVVGDQLEIKLSTKGKTQDESIPWPSDCGGFYAVEQSLLDAPMKPGERRTIRAIVPDLYTPGTNELAARDYEPVQLLTGTHDLLRIDTVLRFADGQAIEGALWTDRTGAVMKSRLDALGMEAFRATRAEALEETEPPKFDLVRDVKVDVDRPLPSPNDTKRVRYRVTLADRDPAGVFVDGLSQKVESTGPHTAEVTVYAVRPDPETGNPAAPDDPPTDGDLQPNNFIQSDYPAIVAKAREIAPGESDPWLVAVALERAVKDLIPTSGYTQAFATAAEVIETGEGDCTEHAVLLAALARARGIPARLAVGLVYINQSRPAFYYHMWTEVRVHDRWIPLDATRPQGGTGAGYLKVAQSNFQGASALSAFLPVIQVIGKLKIEILEVE